MTKALELFRRSELPTTAIPVSDLVARALAVRSEKTRQAYHADLLRFAEFTGCASTDEAISRLCATPTAAAQDVVLSYQASLLEQGLAPATINRRISALRSVLKLARGIGATDLTLSLVSNLDPEDATRDTRGPGLEVLREIVTVCDSDGTPRGARDGTIIRWWLGTGLRRNELRSVLMEDFRRTAGAQAAVVGGRGRRVAPAYLLVRQKRKRLKHPIELSAELVAATDPWLRVRGETPGALFCSLDRKSTTGDMLNPTALNRILQRRAEEAGYPGGLLPDGRKITPHAIRHTAITEVILKFGRSHAQAFARHANPATTERYNDEKAMMALDSQAFVFELL